MLRINRREEHFRQKNPVDMQIEIAKELAEIPIDCNVPGCPNKVSMNTMAKHFDTHIVMHRMEKLRKRLYKQKTIAKDQAKEIEELELENGKLLERLKKHETLESFSNSESNIEILEKEPEIIKKNKSESNIEILEKETEITKKNEATNLKKLGLRAAVDIETLPAETVVNLFTTQTHQLSRNEMKDPGRTSEEGRTSLDATMGPELVNNCGTLDLKKLDFMACVEVENMAVADSKEFVVTVTEESNQMSTKLPKLLQFRRGNKRKRNIKSDEDHFIIIKYRQQKVHLCDLYDSNNE